MLAQTGARGASPGSSFLQLPVDLMLRVLGLCSPRALLRAMASCRALLGLTRIEGIWADLLAEITLRHPRSNHYGARRWWLCRVAQGQQTGTAIATTREIALPWRCASTAQCKLLRQLSFRESYKACLFERGRADICGDDLLQLHWVADFSGIAPVAGLPGHLRPPDNVVATLTDQMTSGENGDGCGGVPAMFHGDGCFEDSVFSTRHSGSSPPQWRLRWQTKQVGTTQRPPAVEAERLVLEVKHADAVHDVYDVCRQPVYPAPHGCTRESTGYGWGLHGQRAMLISQVHERPSL